MSEPLGPQNGAAGVPLPSEPAAGQSPEPADLDTLDERRRLGSELALQAANRRAAEAQTAAQELRRWISELERSLQAARREPERLIALLAERERSQRIAEQQAHAERARRLELEEQLAAVMREREAVADRSQLAA